MYNPNTMGFLPTPSARRATQGECLPHLVDRISTHALREEGDRVFLPCQLGRPISTHALREEGDCIFKASAFAAFSFLPTPSARRATLADWIADTALLIFLPTPSARRATQEAWADYRYHPFLPTPSARRATCHFAEIGQHRMIISTHALREEGD